MRYGTLSREAALECIHGRHSLATLCIYNTVVILLRSIDVVVCLFVCVLYNVCLL